jgi:hypothetical protein
MSSATRCSLTGSTRAGKSEQHAASQAFLQSWTAAAGLQRTAAASEAHAAAVQALAAAAAIIPDRGCQLFAAAYVLGAATAKEAAAAAVQGCGSCGNSSLLMGLCRVG